MELFKQVVTDILTTLYQPFWFTVSLTVALSFVYLYSYHPYDSGKGLKAALKAWISELKQSSFFRRLVLLIFYSVMILNRTLYYRGVWLNPLQDVMGGWWIWKTSHATGEVSLSSECFANILLMMPFVFLLLLTFKDRLLSSMTFCKVTWFGVKTGFLFSLGIESAQLFLRLGTFQFSDLTYNTLGGLLGGIIYWVGWRIKYRKYKRN